MVKKGDVVKVSHPIIQKKIDKSLKSSIKEGSLASISTSFGLSYFAPFALALSATTVQMGILHAIISLLPGIAQLKASTLIGKFSRKKIILTALMIRILLFLPIILTGILFYFGVPHTTWILIGLVGLFYVTGAIVHPAWFSWMGSLVPTKKRGSYFSERNRIAGFFGIIAMVAGALILDGMKDIGIHYGNALGFTLFGFGILFSLAATSRIWSWRLLKGQYEPRLKIKKKDYFTFGQFLKKSPSTPFGRFVLFRTISSIAIGIAGPFWVVYVLRNLGFSYFWNMLTVISAIIFQLIFLPLLGKVSDKFGNIKLISICSWLLFAIPVLWIGSALIVDDLALKLYLLFVPAIAAGFAWAGYNLAVNNYIYDAVSSPKRGFGVSYMNLMVGVGAFIGASIGSLLAWINVSFMNPILFIFAVSAFARLLVAIFGLRFLSEVRHVQKFSSEFLIKEFQPMKGGVRDIHNLGHIVDKVEHYI